MIDRRTFIQSAALIAATSAAAVLLPRSLTAQSLDPRSVRTVQAMVDDGTNRSLVVFRIDGWDRCDGHTASSNEVVIKINHSWRTAWR